uniref:Uncharacterized protein n=1 Tax=Candidatus Kentrum sp. LPFa TaxID=2126335 RepID=A0A450XS24_9GAMM|nr:MAG: hypothetical protein BECKLPF1236A_GA0070988_101578 [Candidatus Kentron sp. LPFa]VFK32073.1 MAG: hypothetical protein BECKLPF1236C_GA0070990_101567 [Candidatus Kentron sp. LPFa]
MHSVRTRKKCFAENTSKMSGYGGSAPNPTYKSRLLFHSKHGIETLARLHLGPTKHDSVLVKRNSCFVKLRPNCEAEREITETTISKG